MTAGRTDDRAGDGPQAPTRAGNLRLTSSAFADALAARSDADLVRLLALRPDLASPAPSSLLALAARAATRASLERALAGLDAATLAVAEAVAAHIEATPDALAAATGLPASDAGDALARLEELALVVDGRTPDALAQSFGQYPAGLAAPPDGRGSADPDDAATSRSVPTRDVPTRDEIESLLADAPESARRTFDAMLWGPPVGTTASSTLPTGAAWLLEQGLLERPDAHTVLLPRAVALAARGGRTHRRPPLVPHPTPRPRPASIVAAESARAAEELVRRVEELLESWTHHPAASLRTGGIGVREVRRTAADLGVDEPTLALVAEVAAAAGLLWCREDAPIEWAPSDVATTWLAEPVAERWADLAEAWLGSTRAPWLAGTREPSGTLRAVLGPQLDAPRAARLRAEAAAQLAEHPGAEVPAEDVAAVLAFRHPRLPARDAEPGSVLAEFRDLGITGAGALAPAAHDLVAGRGPDAAARSLREAMPDPVDELIVQGDLTAVVPGPPTARLAALLALTADVESRGSALTVRFSEGSLRRAFDAGHTAESLLADLSGFSRPPLPQPLEYLVGDVARRHGTLRLGAAGTYVRAPGSEPLVALLGRPELADLDLRMLAPTVAVSPESPEVVASALRRAGEAPVVEDAAGGAIAVGGAAAPLAGMSAPARVGGVRAGAGAGAEVGAGASAGRGAQASPARRGRRRGAARPPTSPGRLDPTDALVGPGSAAPTTGPGDGAPLAAVVARARAGEAQAREAAEAAARAGGGSASDPVLALEVLREAVATRSAVDVVLVGAAGAADRRRVVPVAVENGRVRMRDARREVEITVAVSRIASATPAG